MSNIVKNKDDLLFLSDILKYIKCNKVSKSFIEDELSKLLPNYQDNLIKLCVNDRGNVYPCFLPKYREIMLYINKIEDWVNVNSNAFFNQYNGSDLDLFKGYMFIYLFTHEVEHSYQFLMGENLIDSPSFFLSSAYKGIFDLLTPKEYFIPRPIHESRRLLSILLYKINENFYLLERNANVESMDLICKLANFNNNEDIYNLFNDMRNLFLKCGYLNDSYMGSIEETYRKILMYSKYKKFKSDIYLSDDDKIRYGSNIDERLYKKLFKK